jgi:tetratricopeptide (TPR) repeat protein
VSATVTLRATPLLAALLLGEAPVAETAAGQAMHAWLEGNVNTALALLHQLPATRERDLNEAVVLLYSGRTESAERRFRELRARDPSWLPALRWLARAQALLNDPGVAATTEAVLRHDAVTGRDQLWASRVLAKRGDLGGAREALRRAVSEEDDLYVGWTGLADVETALGHESAARAAAERAAALYPGGLEREPLARPSPLDHRLRYRARYFFVPLATVVLTEEAARADERPEGASRLITLEAKSTSILFHIDSRFDTWVDAAGALLSHRNLSNDSATRGQTAADRDAATGAFRVREALDGLLSYDDVPLPPGARAHDGLSMLEAARAVARTRRSIALLRLVSSTWKGALVRAAAAEEITWQHRKVPTVRVEIPITSRSAAGTVGTLQLWISADERAIPYRARMGISIGSVTLDLQPEADAAAPQGAPIG